MLLKKEEVVKMFQNIKDKMFKNTKDETERKETILTNVISKKFLLLYIVTFMVSAVTMGQDVSPFSLALVAATAASEIPVIAIIIIALIGNIVGAGASSIASFIVTMLLFFASFLVKEPRYNDEERNEKIKLGRRLVIASLLVNVIKAFLSGFMLYDIFVAISITIITFIFYKVFVNSLRALVDFGEKKAFSIEEVIGTSLLLAIALCFFGDFKILGFSIKNVLSIFIVLLLGWKNGILVGATSGITIGVTLGIIDNNEPLVVAAYAISGMIAGALNKLGRPGVIIGFVFGNIVLSYASNGGVKDLILFKEILIAGIALLAVPRNISINIEDLIGKDKMLPAASNRGLNKSKEVAQKLNNVSKAVKVMANAYRSSASMCAEDEDIIQKNKKTFIIEFLNQLENLKDNMLYDYLVDVDGANVNNIFNLLMDRQTINEKELIEILAKENNYIIGFDEKGSKEEKDLKIMVEAINSAYKIGKLNFIWTSKLKEEKQNMESQLNGVSKAILNIAEDMQKESIGNNEYQEEEEQIVYILKQKDILVQDISIRKNSSERFIVELYIEETTIKDVDIFIENTLTKILNEKMIITTEEDLKFEKMTKYTCMADDRFLISIGQAGAVKDHREISGDSILKIRLKDGKYLLAVSDGMGSGPEARKSSQIVIKMLQRLLNSGFEKSTSIDLINTSLLNVSEDVFATLDIAIVDLYKGNVEFIKSGACPTYIKDGKKVQIIKSLALPAGILKDITGEIFDKDIENEEIMVMCTDGIIDSNVEYKNKELWVKYLLEDIENANPQKIADIVLNESIDNNFGKVKDDMSVIVCKFVHK